MAMLLILTCLVGCGGKDGDDTAEQYGDWMSTKEQTNFVKMTFEKFGTVIVELSPADAPITVANFKKLVAKGFYDGLTIHRVSSNFVIQGGDPNGNGTGGSGEPIKGEFAVNGIVNNISHRRGVISMARRGDSYDSATSQFFICLNDATCVPSLDGKYAGFGWVVEGMDVVDAIAAVPKTGERPDEKIVITSMVFVTKDANAIGVTEAQTAIETAAQTAK